MSGARGFVLGVCVWLAAGCRAEASTGPALAAPNASVQSEPATTTLAPVLSVASIAPFPTAGTPRDHEVTSVEAVSSAPGRVGYEARLGSTRFVIWGASAAGPMPKALATTHDSQRLYASNMGVEGEQTLSVYQTNPLRLERHLDLPGKAIELVSAANDRELYVTDTEGWGKVLVLDGAQLAIERSIPVPGFPKWMALHPSGNPLYVALWQLDGVSRVDLETQEVETLRMGKGRYSRHASRDKNPRGMAFSKDGGTLIVANNADETLSLVDTKTFRERRRIRVGYAPRHVVVTRAGRVFVSLTGNDSVLEFDIDTETSLREIPVGSRPKTMVLSQDERLLYVANFAANSLSVVDLGSFERVEIPLGLHKPSGLAVRQDDRFVYVSGFCTADVWALERLDPGAEATRPLGPDRMNEPCLDCAQSFEGCPYFGGPTEIRESPAKAPTLTR